MNPQAADDLGRFLDVVPQHAGKGALIAGGIAWGFAAAIGLFTIMQVKDLTELRAKLQESEALKPIVPTMTMAPAPADDLKRLTDDLKKVYPELTINVNGSKVSIQSKKTSDYGMFREAIGHIVNGGVGWKVSVENLCVGRECKQNALDSSIKVEKIQIDTPAPVAQ
jgi:hypothetical protein